jgi:hypothetical protein
MHARIHEQSPHVEKLVAVARVDGGVDGHFQPLGAHAANGCEHACERSRGAKAVVLGFEAVQAEANTGEAGTRSSSGIARLPLPSVRDEPHLHLLTGQTQGQFVPGWMQRRFATRQGHAAAAQLRQLVGDAQAFLV